MTYRQCPCCDRIYNAISRSDAEKAISQFNTFYDNLDKLAQEENYGGKRASIKDYKKCFVCNTPYSKFRVGKNIKWPEGNKAFTVSPVLKK